MKNYSIIMICVLVFFISCTKSAVIHPEIGDGSDEIVSVGIKEVHVEYRCANFAELQKVVFHYGLLDSQQFESADMTKKETFFELSLNHLLDDTLYCYYFELFPFAGSPIALEHKSFHTLFMDTTDPLIDGLPVVLTTEISDVFVKSAVCCGEVVSEGGAEIIERGVCWSSNESPTVYNRHTIVDGEIGDFVATINGLRANTTYHVRAYATNEIGTTYGIDKEFTTLSGDGNNEVPIGAINGLFSINGNGDQVYFSKGNLRYQASTNIWCFAENQWYTVGGGNNNISQTYNGWIDLFGWGTSGYNHGAVCYQPWSISENPDDYFAYGQDCYDLSDCSGRADWGYNAIENGGNIEGLWRTPTKQDWDYIINNRITTSGIRFAKAKVANVFGLLLLPDSWRDSYYTLNDVNQHEAVFESNIISNTEFRDLEQLGVVFLPYAQYREGIHWVNSDPTGFYWSSSCGYTPLAISLVFRGYEISSFLMIKYNTKRTFGHSVRLVQDAN